jgi:hypothetical protein
MVTEMDLHSWSCSTRRFKGTATRLLFVEDIFSERIAFALLRILLS